MEHTNDWILQLRLEDSGEVLFFNKTRLRIGRALDCDVCFSDVQAVSRLHAEIFFRSGSWYIRDCCSNNGTWLHEERLASNQEYPLSAGDSIDLAHKLRIIFVEGKAPVQPLEAPAAQRQFCRFCGAYVTGAFCLSCGRTVDSIPAAACPMPLSAMSAPSMTVPRPAPPAPSMAAPTKAPTPVPMSKPPAPAAAKKGLLSKIRSLFDGKSQNTVSDVASTATDDIQFRGTTPKTIQPGAYFPVKIMMYREDDYLRADRESAAIADQTVSASSGVFQAAYGQNFRIALQSPDIALDCETQQMQWNGKFATADFEVYLPEDYDRRQLRLRGRVYADNAVLTDLKLILQVGAVQPQNIICEKVQLRSAFISYASSDRAKVAARIQGILLARPDMDLFFDVESLRRGEHWESRLYQEIAKRDLFYLFWSQNAAASEWVQKELQYAMVQKTADYIEPIPLEGPESCPPPQCLLDKHFNDWTLRYLNNQ